MIAQHLLDYILVQGQQGVTDEVIRRNLIKNNWSEVDINQAFQQ